MIGLVIVAFMAVLGILIMMGRLNMRRFLGYPNLVDIACTLIFVLLFAGTFSGMVVAGFASLFMSIMLWVLRSIMGAERLELHWIGRRVKRPVFVWVHIPASEMRPHWLVRLFKGPAKKAGV